MNIRYPFTTIVCTFVVIDLCAFVFAPNTPDLPAQVMSSSLAAALATVALMLFAPHSLDLRALRDREEALMVRDLLIVAFVGGLLILAISNYYQDVRQPHQLQPQTIPFALLICLFTGIFEEGFFRGLVIPCALARTDGNISPEERALSAAFFSSILFAVVHVTGGSASEVDADADTALIFFQALLKAVQAGLFGFCMAALFLRTSSAIAPMAVHAVFDALYLGPQLISTAEVPATYLTASLADVVVLVVTIVLLLPPCAKSLRWMREGVVTYTSSDD